MQTPSRSGSHAPPPAAPFAGTYGVNNNNNNNKRGIASGTHNRDPSRDPYMYQRERARLRLHQHHPPTVRAPLAQPRLCSDSW